MLFIQAAGGGGTGSTGGTFTHTGGTLGNGAIPQLIRAFREELAAERESCRSDRAEHQEAFKGISERLDRIEGKLGRNSLP